MPLSSMTGFGQAEKTTPSGTYRVELRGVNNRFLEIQLRTPRVLSNLEARIKKHINQAISRGSITLTITWDQENMPGSCSWNKAAVTEYIRILKEIKKEFKLAGEITIANLVDGNDLIKVVPAQYSDQTLWNHISPILSAAIKDFQKQREIEAKYLAADLRAMVLAMRKLLKKIEARSPVRLKKQKHDLTCRIESLAGDKVDPARIATEIAIIADKLDISEECTRLHAHIDKFAADLECNEPVGKRLGFLLQELNREANTIGSKANDTDIAHYSVELKEFIEKIREQIQNIE
jgi:uncharacterized protein (TIGR00255 family)